MTSLEVQMFAFMKRVTSKGKMEKSVQMVEKTPLLPTPGQKILEEGDASLWIERPAKNQWISSPKVELPFFCSESPREWV